ncbi:hypothetical protein F4801DRAFT_576514 [Xylaria longipes]|nr:hypothetical protein F4801DRAFT_576514 [Xylaria longipes]
MLINFLVTIIVALSAAGLVAAKNCRIGGDYINRITTRLRANNKTTDDFNIQNSLWACIIHGDIAFMEVCPVGCVGGTKRLDYCAAKGIFEEGEEEEEEEAVA